MRKLLFVAAVSLSSLAPSEARACSMCRCGDPTYSLVGSQLFVPRTFTLGFDADRYEKDQVAEAEPGREREVEQRYTLSAAYTFGRRFTALAFLPLVRRSITAPGGSDSFTGLSDPEFLLHYRALSPRPGSWLSLSAGVRPGWGKNDAARDGARLEEHLQPGIGATSASAGLSFSRVVGAADDSSIFGSVTGRLNGRNDVGYHYGNLVLANVGYERKIGRRFNAVLEANFRYAARDEVARGIEDPNTGGSVLYLTPRVILKVDQKHFFRLGLQIPVAKGLYGDQDEKVNVIGGLSVRF